MFGPRHSFLDFILTFYRPSPSPAAHLPPLSAFSLYPYSYIEEHTTFAKGEDPMDSAFISLLLFALGGLIGNTLICVLVARGCSRRFLISALTLMPCLAVIGLAFVKDPSHIIMMTPLLEAVSACHCILYT